MKRFLIIVCTIFAFALFGVCMWAKSGNDAVTWTRAIIVGGIGSILIALIFYIGFSIKLKSTDNW